MVDVVPKWLPGGVIWVYVTGVGFILAAIAILINVQTKLACYLLAGMLLVFIGTIHVPAMMEGDPVPKQMAMLMMLKDVGLVMAALLVGYNSDKPDEA
jgi:uncharacterized membrane protein YphA (DoxX/SURF4 family)